MCRSRLERTAPVRRGVAFLLLATVACAGCGSSGQSSSRDRTDARAYVAAARHFDRQAQALIQSADERTARTFHECSLVRLSVVGLPPLSRLAGITFIAYYQALLPAYRRYALRLRSIHARDSTLVGVARAARDLGDHYATVRTAHPDYCHALRLWRAARWTKTFSVMAAIGASRRAFDERGFPRLPVIMRAEVRIAVAGDHLGALGVRDTGVMAFLLATDAFAAARGGYTEVADLARR